MTTNYLHQSIGNFTLLCLLMSIFVVAHNQQPIFEEHTKKPCLVIKIAVFVDTSLKAHLHENLKLNYNQIRRLVQSYIEQVEVIFSTLKTESISRIHLELVGMRLERFPAEFSNNSTSFDRANIDKLLGEFCQYQHKERPRNWDLGLLLTSRDLYSEEEAKFYESHKLSSTTMGISIVNGVDWPDLSCLIVEFGMGYKDSNLEDSEDNRVYPTRGFGSAWVTAHEIAHSLGIYHDGPPFNEECPHKGFIMSSSNYVKSMSHKWSLCSSKSLDGKDLNAYLKVHDHSNDLGTNHVRNLPGQLFDAQFQCKFFSELLTQSSQMGNRNMCNESLICSTESNRLVAVGPALEGTQCKSDGSLCIRNSCIPLEKSI